jgi:hypothetical protein
MREQDSERLAQINSVRAMLDWLEEHPEVELPMGLLYDREIWVPVYDDEEAKTHFFGVAKAFGTYEKDFSDPDKIRLVKKFGHINLTTTIARHKVCTKRIVQKTVDVEEWDCEPLLSAAEMAQLDGASAEVSA